VQRIASGSDSIDHLEGVSFEHLTATDFMAGTKAKPATNRACRTSQPDSNDGGQVELKVGDFICAIAEPPGAYWWQSSKSPQSSSICNHTLARGDLLDSRL
jgi:hypothetical protein